MRTTVLMLLLVSMLVGCATETLVERRMNLMPPNLSESGKAGYADGCQTVVTETCMATGGAFRRDDARMKTDQDYAMGWGDGTRICSCAGNSYMFVPMNK